MTTDPQSIITRAAQLGGPGSVPEIADGDIFKLPKWGMDFVSEAFPQVNGRIELRFPSFGDEVEIERLAVMRGGTALARAQASFMVCLESAPACWWRPSPSLAPGAPPVPAIDRLPCSPELVGAWQNWLIWRDSFRSGAPSADL
jgi:hypothetical protein